jgi:hypothetical protein
VQEHPHHPTFVGCCDDAHLRACGRDFNNRSSRNHDRAPIVLVHSDNSAPKPVLHGHSAWQSRPGAILDRTRRLDLLSRIIRRYLCIKAVSRIVYSPVYSAGLLKIHRVGWAIGAEHAMWQSWLRLEYDRVVSNEPTTLPIVLLGILLVLLVVVWGYFFYHLGGGG